MKSFRIGHYTDLKKGTGCTVIICPDGTKASAHARGVSPGTREFALLSPFRKVEEIHALFLTGGSAFGIDAAAGVMQFLFESGKGYKTTFQKIPIVPAAVIYDLLVLDSSAFPKAEDAYAACKSAKHKEQSQGTIGAGTGATVGKWAGLQHMMKGGVGIAEEKLNDVWVRCLSIVNPVGDVVDQEQRILAGAQHKGKFLASKDPNIRWKSPLVGFAQNTILSVLMINVDFDKSQLHYLAERTHNGIVRSVIPAHTSFDGDIVFALTTGESKSNIDLVAEIGSEVTRKSILNSVFHATSIDKIPSFKDLSTNQIC
jgi:L-aminopeptidase/D-esterase-like protein